MSRFEPLWKRDYRHIDTRQKELEERLIEAQKRIDKAMSDPVLNYDEWLKQARREYQGDTIADWVREKVKEIDQAGKDEWIDVNLPHFSIGGVNVDFVDSMNDVHHGYYDIGGFYNAKGQIFPIKSVNRWRYARVKRENKEAMNHNDDALKYLQFNAPALPVEGIGAGLPPYCSEAMELDYERRPPFPCYLWYSSEGYWAYFRNDPFPYMLGSKEAYTHWMAPLPPPPPRKRKEAPAWKPIDLDNPPVCPVLVRLSDESTPFVVSDLAGFDGWQFCEIPE